MLVIVVILAAAGLSESARHSSHRLPEFAMPCIAGWWPLGNVAIEIGDGTTRATCLSLPKDAVVAQQGGRWAELDLGGVANDAGCTSSLPSLRIRVGQWRSAKAPQPSYAHPAWGSDFPDYLIFSESKGTSGMEMFVPRNSSSGLRNIACAAGTDKCWAAARDGFMFVKWPTPRTRLVSGLEQDWACIRDVLEAAKVD
ncbi:MAG TPA: hypothetical protein VFE34_07780 [Dongiaceae bacterium]|nr:hypothetical protein [Dongiaceae bacterium]